MSKLLLRLYALVDLYLKARAPCLNTEVAIENASQDYFIRCSKGGWFEKDAIKIVPKGEVTAKLSRIPANDFRTPGYQMPVYINMGLRAFSYEPKTSK